MLRRPLALSLVTASLLLAQALLAGCNSDDETRISPVPAGYAALLRQQRHSEGTRTDQTKGGVTIDEQLAVVDGEHLTRREVLRSLRLSEAEANDPDVDEEIRQARLEWAKQRLIMGAARRAGLRIPESAIDTIVNQQLDGEIETNEEATGVALTQEEYLTERQLTRREYRDQIYGSVVAEYYLRKLFQGIGGTRPDLDRGVSPAEVKRIYYDHREKFDEPAGVKLVMFQLPIESFEQEGRDFLASEQVADETAARIAREFTTGGDPKAIAARHKLEDGTWQVTTDFVVRFPQPTAHAWLFDAQRRPRDVRVFKDAAGPIILGVIESRSARQRTLNDPEVYDLIVNMLQGARRKQMRAKLTIDLLERGGVVWPDELADELLDEAQGELDLIASHAMISKARLR